jgi:hypothetical protein
MVIRRVGLCLLLVGFVVLLGTAFWCETTDIDIFAEAYDSVPQEHTFARKDVQDRLDRLFERLHYRHVSWIVVGGVIMLAGGLMALKRT